MRKDNDTPDIPKIVFLLFTLAIVFMSTSVFLTIFQQKLYINNKTIIDSSIGFSDNNTVNIKGNQVTFTQNDIIPINGKDYIKITGNQVQLGYSIFTPAIRTISAKFYQNIFFEQYVGEFNINRAAQVSIDNDIIALIPLSPNIINVRTQDSNYNVELSQNMTYINTKQSVMLRLQRTNEKVSVYIVGIKNYDNVWMRTI